MLYWIGMIYGVGWALLLTGAALAVLFDYWCGDEWIERIKRQE